MTETVSSDVDGKIDKRIHQSVPVLQIRRLTDDELSEIIFDDHLICATTAGDHCGDYRMSVTSTQTGIKVQVNSEGAVSELSCGTRIESWLNRELETCQEIVSDYLWASPNRLLERRLFLERDGPSVIIWRFETRLRKIDGAAEAFEENEIAWNPQKDGRIDLSSGMRFFGEGANIILQRLVIKKTDCIATGHGYHQWRAISIDDKRNTRECIYTLLGSRDSITFGAQKSVKLFGIERMFPRSEALPAKVWENWFNYNGYLQVRVHLDAPIIMRTPGLMVCEEESCRKLSIMDGGDRLADRRPSVTRTGCLCGIIPGRNHSVRSRRQ